MTREELIKNVAMKMDEISSSDDVIVSVMSGDNNPLYTQINELLNESINDVLMKAPAYRIQDQIVALSGTGTIQELFGATRKAYVISVPEDFLRVVSIVDIKFQRPIVDLAVDGDDISKRQANKFLVAKYAKPVAVLGRDSSGKRIITCYSYDSNDTPTPSISYIQRFSGSQDKGTQIDFNQYLIDIISWACAGRVFAVQGDINRGKICDDNASALMI